MKFSHLLNKISELLFELLQDMLHNTKMIHLTFSNKSNLLLNETSNIWQTEIRINTLIASYQGDTQAGWNQLPASLYLQFHCKENIQILERENFSTQTHGMSQMRQVIQQYRDSETCTQLRSHMLLICTGIEASVPISFFSIREISSLSLRYSGGMVLPWRLFEIQISSIT